MAETHDLFVQQSILFIFLSVLAFAQDEHHHFIFNGFQGSNLDLDGLATIQPDGLLQLTNTSHQLSGYAFYPQPFHFNATSSFSTSFVFAMNPDVQGHGGHGIAFVISPSMNFNHSVPAEFLGLFNLSNNGNSSNHIFDVELDTVQNAVFGDINGNHVGIDVNGLTSNVSASAAYYDDQTNTNISLQLTSREAMQVWIDYNGYEKLMNVSLAPVEHPKPEKPLLSNHLNLSSVFLDSMYVGFSASTGLTANEHYLLGWSWSQIGQAQGFNFSELPSLPRFKNPGGTRLDPVFIALIAVSALSLVVVAGSVYARRRKMFAEVKEPWEEEYSSHRFSYKDLYVATKGFKDSELLGSGGFGKVYKGLLPSTDTQVAIKRVSHNSKQGMREFVAEIVSMRRLRHRNLIQLLGYCRRKGELLLVYDFMPNGSLDKLVFQNKESALSWVQRMKIIKGVASALLYLHEEWEQVVLHRDVKASNVLLDAEMNAKLGDFGLARLYDHGSNPRSTNIVGTVGYLAPELSITGKPTPSTDVFAFGIFLLEVACGVQPFRLLHLAGEDLVLVDWVFECWKKGAILDTSDPKLEGYYDREEMQVVLKLGLHCSHTKPEARPRMRQAVQFLHGDAVLPEVPSDYDLEKSGFFDDVWGTSGSFPSSSQMTSDTLFTDHSIVHHGR